MQPKATSVVCIVQGITCVALLSGSKVFLMLALGFLLVCGSHGGRCRLKYIFHIRLLMVTLGDSITQYRAAANTVVLVVVLACLL